MRRPVATRAIAIAALPSLFLLTCASPPEPRPPLPQSIVLRQSPDRDETIDALLASMSLRERIGQRFVIHVPRRYGRGDGAIDAAFHRVVKTGAPAGIIVYPWNYDSRDDLSTTIDKLQRYVDRSRPHDDLIVAADQEGGRVLAVRSGSMVRPSSAREVARYRDDSFVESLAYVVATELRASGVTMNLAPVLDLTAGRAGGIIGDRSYGDDPQLVAELGRAYLRGMRRGGVIATAKHFPGHGVTEIDSHGRLPRVAYSREDLMRDHIVPFAAAIEAGVPAIMTAHILFPRIDAEWPVTLSTVFLQTMLREELGFDGVIISDGLEMGALRNEFPLEVTLERVFAAEVDLILLYASYDVIEIVEIVEGLIDAGLITEAQIDRGARRVLALKHEYGLLSLPRVESTVAP